ncbi:alpha/beta fold hydrolase [Nocardia sp. NPDC050175]|uniref:alpha/beta fold hydrolase n=1 Tax=Nocardia sp. NPDC050175 TaxID=3364317 RepID=UPI0037B7F82D
MNSSITRTVNVELPGLGSVAIRLSERGEGRPVLLLHGGAGSVSVTAFADRFAAERHVRVSTPTHPGFDGTERPESLTAIGELAALYAALLDTLDLTDVTVVGNSVGGWIAAELALLHPDRVSSVVLVDAVGIEVPDHPIIDFFVLDISQVADFSYADPDTYRIDPAQLSPAVLQVMAANRGTLQVYGGSMVDPTLRGRLPEITLPTLVIWGDADRVTEPENGRAFADAIPNAEFVIMKDTGHLPQIESPAELIPLLWDFADAHAVGKPVA